MFVRLLTIGLILMSQLLCAQGKWGWDVAAAGMYAKDIDAFGPQIRAYFLVNEHICFGPEFGGFSFSHSDGSGETGTIDLFELNLNIHYVFEFGHRFGAYPLAGLNWSSEREAGHSRNEIGINMGTGFHVFANRWVPFAEYVYLAGDLSDHKFILGTYFIIKDIEKKKH